MKNLILFGTCGAVIYNVMKAIAKRYCEASDIDTNNTYLNKKGQTFPHFEDTGRYEEVIKPMFDRAFAFIGLLMLSPLYVGIAAAIYMDDPGPIFFNQIRVGKDKHFFTLHKFRTMRMDTPHNVPTHQLSDPEQYITKVGRLLRKTSLDELPQLWDIFRGKMSIIGPRPALFNQEDLIAERDKYFANNIMPGLSGLAQIQGRDELEIYDKAAIDGEYTRILKGGGISAFFQDICCFTRTFMAVWKQEGVVEGGTGNIDNTVNLPKDEAGRDDYGYKKKFHIDTDSEKHILITGAESYIGESLKKYVKSHYPTLSIETIDMTELTWRDYDFHGFDAVFHVAGIAHSDIGNVSREVQQKYYSVNTDLAIEVCQKAKESGVKQFIFMSSMIIYGDGARYGKEKVIDERTIPSPSNFYGDSKWQADRGVRKLASDTFRVAVLRPPMIYGKGAKGNYSTLVKLAKWFPIFPDVENQRSMLYIGNLCEFVSLLILSGEGGIYFPQNDEYSSTSLLVREIGITMAKPVYVVKCLRPFVQLLSNGFGKWSGLINKAFGNNVYDQRLSTYDGLNYQIWDVRRSIIDTKSETA